MSASETPIALRMFLRWLAVERAASGEEMSGSVTISMSGVPPRLKSMSEPTEPCIRPDSPTWTFLAASSSRWSLVMPTLTVSGGYLDVPLGDGETVRVGASYWEIWYPLGRSG